MSGSESAQGDETRAKEDVAARWGEQGLARGRDQHGFISARMEQTEEGCKALEARGGDQAIGLVAEMLDGIPGEPTRQQIREMLRREFGNTEDTEYLLDDLRDVWETFDLLIEIFGVEAAQKMVNALPDSASL